jgi:peroxiredoxin
MTEDDKMRHGLTWIAILLFVTVSYGGEFNPVLSIGDKVPFWKDLPGVDGKKHSLADLKARDAVVLVFTCNSCPYAVEYEERIKALTKEFQSRNVAVVAVNVNNVPEDRLDKMQERAKKVGFNFPYLFDTTQQIARDFGAGFTPEIFVLDKQRKIAYMGALDDNPVADKVKVRHVSDVLNSLLDGKKVTITETVPIGCRIRMDRRRRRP